MVALYVTFPTSSVSTLLGVSCFQEQFLFRDWVLLRFLMKQKWVEVGFCFVVLIFFFVCNYETFSSTE